jgi:microcystin-dependent protein
VSRTTYANLFAAIGTAHGSGDGVTTFTLPDYRGRFLRGVDEGAGRDPDAPSRTAPSPGGNSGDAVGSIEPWSTGMPNAGFSPNLSFSGQTDVQGAHSHVYNTVSITQGYYGYPYYYINYVTGTPSATTSISGAHSHNVTGTVTGTIGGGDKETRPVNAGVFWIIKY